MNPIAIRLLNRTNGVAAPRYITYSQRGNNLFPLWECDVPSVGISLFLIPTTGCQYVQYFFHLYKLFFITNSISFPVHSHFFSSPFFAIYRIGVGTSHNESYRLVAMNGRGVVVEHPQSNLLNTQFMLCMIDSET